MKCAYVEDLFPLYEEGLISEETRKDIEEHLRTCETCRMKFQNPLPPAQAPTPLETPVRDQIERKAVRRYRHKLLRLIAIIAAAALLAGGGSVFGWLTYNRHPHTVYSTQIDKRFDQVDFQKLGQELLYHSNAGTGRAIMPGNGFIVRVDANGNLHDIDAQFTTQASEDAGKRERTDDYETQLDVLSSNTVHLNLIQQSTGTVPTDDADEVGGRDPRTIFFAFSKLPIRHVLEQMASLKYKYLNLAFSDEEMGTMYATENGVDSIVSIGVTPSASLRCFSVKSDGTIEELHQRTIVDRRKYAIVYISANADGNPSITGKLEAGARLAYVIQLS